MSSDNAMPWYVIDEYTDGYLRLSSISTCFSYVFDIATTSYISSLLACDNSNMIDEIIIITRSFAVISRVAK